MKHAISILILATVLIFGCAGQETSDDAHLDRMTEEHKNDRPEASPAAQADAGGEVETSRVVYATVDGQEITGYLARPAGMQSGIGAGAPGVIVIQEWWGLNENIESMARQLAGEGYLALAVDLYGGEVASEPDDARRLMQAAMESPEKAEDNLRQAHTYLRRQGAGSIGSIGWCFGGGWSLRTALMLGDELDAAIIYYGRLITDRDQLASLTTPVLGIFGSEDRGIPLDSVREFESVLQDLGKPVTVQVYEGADHAFANPSGTRYQAEAATDAWKRTLAFFAEHLKG